MEKESNSQMDFHLYKGAWINTKAPHLYNKLSDEECKTLLKSGGFIVRNTYHFDLSQETTFWYVIKDAFGGMDELSSKTRNQIRRAFNTLHIKIINKSSTEKTPINPSSSARTEKIKSLWGSGK